MTTRPDRPGTEGWGTACDAEPHFPAPASKISDHLIEQAKAVPIQELVSRVTPVRRAGRDFIALCPFHAERTPSFHIYSHDNHFHCNGCGAHGNNAVDFVIKHDGLSFPDAVRQLLAHLGISTADYTPETTAARLAREAARAQREAELAAEQEAKNRRAADRARKIWSMAAPAAAGHPYLTRKGVNAAGLRQMPVAALTTALGYQPKVGEAPLQGRVLLGLVRTGNGVTAVTSVEMIDEDGRKSALAGGKKGGSFWAPDDLPEGDGAGRTFGIGEGIATVKSVADLTGWTPIAAFGCGNLLAVARLIRGMYPKAEIVIIGDAGNGASKATEAAAEVGADCRIPVFPASSLTAGQKGPSDFNDLKGIDPAIAKAQLLGAPAVVGDEIAPPDHGAAVLAAGPFARILAGSQPLSSDDDATRFLISANVTKPLPPAVARFNPAVAFGAHGRRPALLLIAHDGDDQPQTVVALALTTAQDGRVSRAIQDDGAAVPPLVIRRGAVQPIVLEGADRTIVETTEPEDALALWSSSGATVVLSPAYGAVFADLAPDAEILIAGSAIPERRHVAELAIRHYQAIGRRAAAIYPPAPAPSWTAMHRSDNYAIPRAIAAQIDAAGLLAASRAACRRTTDAALAAAKLGDAMASLVVADCGIGKTECMVQTMAADISEAGSSWGFGMPTHQMLMSVEARANSGTNKAVITHRYVGPEQPDPRDNPLKNACGECMAVCPMHETLSALSASGCDNVESLCGTEGNYCEYNPLVHKVGCYRKVQPDLAEKANLPLYPANMIFEKMPPWLHKVDGNVLDEAGLLAAINERPLSRTLDDLLYQFRLFKTEAVIKKNGKPGRRRKTLYDEYSDDPTDLETAKYLCDFLTDIKGRLEQSHKKSVALKNAADLVARQADPKAPETPVFGALHMEFFQDIDIGDLDHYALHIFSYKKKIKIEPNEHLDADALKEVRQLFSKIAAISALLKAIASALRDNHTRNPFVTLKSSHSKDAKTDEDKGQSLSFAVTKCKEIHEDFLAKPLIFMDATASEEILRRFVKDFIAHKRITATPYRYTQQVFDAQIAASCFTPRRGMEEDAAELADRADFVKRMYNKLKKQARRFYGQGKGDYDLLAVCQIGMEAYLLKWAEHDPDMKRVAIRHYNNLRGIDDFKGVACVMPIGRCLPHYAELCRIASALFNVYIEPVPYIKVTKTVTDKRGRTVTLTNLGHPNPYAQLLLDFILVTEILQVIERGRSVLRDPLHPLHVIIVTNWALPIEIDEFIKLASLDPAPEDEQAAEGVWLESAPDRCRAYPVAYPAADFEAQRRALSREKMASKKDESTVGTSGHRESIWPLVPKVGAGLPSWSASAVAVRYQPLGKGQPTRLSGFDSAIFPTIDAIISWLSRRVGHLNSLVVEAAPQAWREANAGLMALPPTALKAAVQSISQAVPGAAAPKTLEQLVAEQANQSGGGGSSESRDADEQRQQDDDHMDDLEEDYDAEEDFDPGEPPAWITEFGTIPIEEYINHGT